MGKNVIVACDFSSREDTLSFLEKLGEARPYVKIGLELFYIAGPDMVRELKDRGHQVFLDLKLHDIPHTVQRTMAALTRLGADIINVHAAGTCEMMQAALAGAERPDGTRPLVIAVTQLTSTSEERMRNELLITATMPETVSAYAINARHAGLDGVVCSPLEAPLIHRNCGSGFLTVTPGVRFADEDLGDQVRVATPARAKELGSDYIVVGRPITRAADPLAAWQRCMREFVDEGE
ncbi:MAG: orotidine-5'-phosphate decarboxylase [Firmicutes bacterium]|nr:orotidine-5'-phosphate decarboxylase [Bacillota bacterium]